MNTCGTVDSIWLRVNLERSADVVIKPLLIAVYTVFLMLLMQRPNWLMLTLIMVSFLVLLHWAEDCEQT